MAVVTPFLDSVFAYVKATYNNDERLDAVWAKFDKRMMVARTLDLLCAVTGAIREENFKRPYARPIPMCEEMELGVSNFLKSVCERAKAEGEEDGEEPEDFLELVWPRVDEHKLKSRIRSFFFDLSRVIEAQKDVVAIKKAVSMELYGE